MQTNRWWNINMTFTAEEQEQIIDKAAGLMIKEKISPVDSLKRAMASLNIRPKISQKLINEKREQAAVNIARIMFRGNDKIFDILETGLKHDIPIDLLTMMAKQVQTVDKMTEKPNTTAIDGYLERLKEDNGKHRGNSAKSDEAATKL